MAQVGGKRPGAGRPKGAANQKTREIADRCAKEGLTPLEVMLDVMRKSHALGEYDKSLDAAAKAAPYMHARLSSVDLKTTIKKSVSEFSRDELLAIAALARTGGVGPAEEGRRESEPDRLH